MVNQSDPLPLLFKTAMYYDDDDSEMILNPIELGKENLFRRVTQVLDIMSLHNGIHSFRRPSLALTIVVLALMQEFEIIDFSSEQYLSLL